MFDLRSCLACLNQNCKLERMSDSTRRLYCTVTGLEFAPGDCYPFYLCTECSAQIRKIQAFRRRCRRAYFVLKEIVCVRKKVTLADLSTVDRKKTNLKSSIDYCNNNNTGFYSVNKDEETDTKPSIIREILTDFEPTDQIDIQPDSSADTRKYSPEVINNTYISVDIKPENCEIADDEDCKQIDGDERYTSDGDMGVNDDVVNDEAADEDVPDNIDLEDVFKGLPEEKSDEDSDYGLPELPEPELKENKEKMKMYGRRRRRKDNEECKKVSRGAWAMHSTKAEKLSRNLLDFDIQLLPFEEQIDMFQARKDSEPYKSAGFKCGMCLIVFSGMLELYAHVKVHNDKLKYMAQNDIRKYQCTICKDVFGSQEELTCHSARYHWYKYHCRECGQDQYTLFDALKCHNRPPNPMPRYFSVGELFKMSDMTSLEQLAPMERNCRYCGKRIIKRRLLEKHEKVHVETLKNFSGYQCAMCGIGCQLKVHLESHIYTHYRTFTCKLCDQVLQGWNAAHDHLKKHKKFTCRSCGQIFRSDLERRKHQVKRHADINLDCNVCGLPTFSLIKMYFHQLVDHGYISLNDKSLGDPNYRCDVCDIQFVDEASLDTHRKKRGHVGANKFRGQCQTCKKIYFTVQDFVEHRRDNVICKKYPVKCVYCDEMLSNFRKSERHYAQMHPTQPNEHENAMRFTICEYCGKTIGYYNIKAHTKRHIMPGGEPMLRCRLCNHKMFTSRLYVSHMLYNHTPKPYMCAQCPYRAQYRSECREHILKVHAPELLYSCQKCTRRFSHLDLLQEHSVKSHGLSVKTDRSVYLPAKDVMGKIFVYPHMKLDGSFIPPAVIEDAGLYLYDYLCKSHKLVDWRDYYVFNTGVEPVDPAAYNHRKRVHKSKKGKQKRVPKKPVDEAIIKAIESQSNLEVVKELKENVRRGRKRKSDFGDGIVKIARLDDNERSEMVLESDMFDLEATGLGEPSEAVLHVHKKSQQNSSKKKDTKKLVKPVGNINVEEIESESVNNDRVEVAELDYSCYDDDADISVDNVEHEELVQGYDMPDLEAAILGSASHEHAAETAEQEEEEEEQIEEESAKEDCEKIDVSQLISENYEVIEENGEQFVLMNGNLYRLQFE